MGNNEQVHINKGVMARIRANLSNLSNSEREVSDFVSANPEKVIQMSLSDLANAAGVSDATALRFSRSIGFSGFNEMKMALVADLAVPADAIFEEILETDSIGTIARKVVQSNIQLLQDTANILDYEDFGKIIKLICAAKCIYVYSVGTSSPLAEVLYNRLFRLGYRSSPITDAYLQIMQVALLTKDDVLITISRSGAPSTLVKAVNIARSNGAKTIAITCDAHSPIAKAAEHCLTAVSREIRTEVVESPVTLITVIDAIYIALMMQDRSKTVNYQRKIWEAMTVFRK